MENLFHNGKDYIKITPSQEQCGRLEVQLAEALSRRDQLAEDLEAAVCDSFFFFFFFSRKRNKHIVFLFI